ncbi:hypothetical protein, partial [Pseudomonas sp. GW456-12-10-14-LB2]|uniref:hypothetical protein n=1 Tax=Pseudomonas sp. GW456-12-10-14-LB2 TaxID=2070674 RepID=UPI0013050393
YKSNTTIKGAYGSLDINSADSDSGKLEGKLTCGFPETDGMLESAWFQANPNGGANVTFKVKSIQYNLVVPDNKYKSMDGAMSENGSSNPISFIHPHR